MRNILFIFLAMEISIPSTVVASVFCIPNLVSHFYEHKEEGKEIHFWEFLNEHIQPTHQHSDKDAHDSLPFSQHLSDSLQHLNYVPQFFGNIFKLFSTIIQKFDYQSLFSISNFHSSIWRPPQSIF